MKKSAETEKNNLTLGKAFPSTTDNFEHLKQIAAGQKNSTNQKQMTKMEIILQHFTKGEFLCSIKNSYRSRRNNNNNLIEKWRKI